MTTRRSPSRISTLSTRFDPNGAVCIVTGAASGIGRELCIELARENAKAIVVTDLNLRGCQDTCSLIAKHSQASSAGSVSTDTLALKCDVSSEADICRVIARAGVQFGRIDCFVCNAGVMSFGGVDTCNQEWERMMGINVMQSVYVARHMIPRWKTQGKGALLIVASAAGLLTSIESFPYGVSKSAALAVADWIAIRHGLDDNIHVSCLCPQAVRTGMTDPKNTGLDSDASIAALDGMIEPKMVAEAAVSGMKAGKFLILPHKQVQKYFQFRANDYERWIKGMQRLNAKNEEYLLSKLANLNEKYPRSKL